MLLERRRLWSNDGYQLSKTNRNEQVKTLPRSVKNDSSQTNTSIKYGGAEILVARLSSVVSLLLVTAATSPLQMEPLYNKQFESGEEGSQSIRVDISSFCSRPLWLQHIKQILADSTPENTKCFFFEHSARRDGSQTIK